MHIFRDSDKNFESGYKSTQTAFGEIFLLLGIISMLSQNVLDTTDEFSCVIKVFANFLHSFPTEFEDMHIFI